MITKAFCSAVSMYAKTDWARGYHQSSSLVNFSNTHFTASLQNRISFYHTNSAAPPMFKHIPSLEENTDNEQPNPLTDWESRAIAVENEMHHLQRLLENSDRLDPIIWARSFQWESSVINTLECDASANLDTLFALHQTAMETLRMAKQTSFGSEIIQSIRETADEAQPDALIVIMGLGTVPTCEDDY